MDLLRPRALWTPRKPLAPDDALVQALAEALALPSSVAGILAARGYEQVDAASRFLRPSLRDLRDPIEMAGMERALEVFVAALKDDQLIALHGDYDADGITSTALMVRFLEDAGARFTVYLPERERDGYGLSTGGVRQLVRRGAGVLVALDCGTADEEALALAKASGVVPVVVDHHPVQEGNGPRSAAAFLNPARAECGFAERQLSAVGVAFYLLVALRRRLRELGWWTPRRPEPDLRAYLDLVALGTVADVVPLEGQNRILVQHGLRQIGCCAVPGIAALCRIARLGATIRASDVAYKLAPRINATGRMGQAMTGFRLLATHDSREAARLASQIEGQNLERRGIQSRMEREAIEMVESRGISGGGVLVLAREGWHPGVVGIVASRMVDRYYVPTVVIALESGLGRGSARSISGVDIGRAILDCREHIVHGGGHAMAAGVTIQESSLGAFRAALGERVRAALDGRRPQPTLRYDAVVELGEVDEALAHALGRLGPFGIGNPEPVLVARAVRVQNRRILKGEHLSCRLELGGRQLDAIGFGLADVAPEEGELVDAAFRVRMDSFRGERCLRLWLKDIRVDQQGVS